MTESSFPTWIIMQRHGMVPDKKGPFYGNKRTEEFLRELYSLYPGCICIVVNDLGAAGWHPQHGYEWLDMYGDNRRRHPRKDEQDNKPVGYLRPSGLELLKTGGAHLYQRRDWQANIPVYAYPAPAPKPLVSAPANPGKDALAEIVAGLEGVTPGKWCQYHPSYCAEAKDAPFSTWDSSHDLSTISQGSRYRIGTFKHASDAAHVDRCSPDTLRSIAAYVAEVELARDNACAELWGAEAQISALQERVKGLVELIRWAHDTLYEINPSNYDHDEVCRINDASVEVIFGLAPTIGETHGKSPEWWATHRAALDAKEREE